MNTIPTLAKSRKRLFGKPRKLITKSVKLYAVTNAVMILFLWGIDMNDKKLDWISNYIKLNNGRNGKRMMLDSSGLEREKSIVMESSDFNLKVAIDCERSVCIKSLCILDGNSDYHISKDYFDMSKFID